MVPASLWQSFPRLETSRLILRALTPADADALYRIFSDKETMRYWSCEPHTSADEARRLIEKSAREAEEGTGIHWAVTLRGDDRLIGKCGYNEWRQAHLRAEVSYIVERQQWGQGVVREALGAVLSFGFGPMDLHSVQAGITPGSEDAARTLRRLGFRLEGHLRESFLADGVFVDSLLYSLLRQDWEGSRDRT